MVDHNLEVNQSPLPRPVVNAMLICDRASRDSKTGKVTLEGIFEVLGATGFPARHEEMAVYVKMTDAAGKYPFTFQVVHLEDGAVIGSGGSTFPAKDRMGTVELMFNIKGLVFPGPGMYEFQIHADGGYLCGKTMNVVRSTAR